MRLVEKPQVFLVSRPSINWAGMNKYLQIVGGTTWRDRIQNARPPDAETLVEFMGRVCYRSWEPGLNPNVTKIREDSKEYLHNVLKSGHGRILEHANFSYVLHDVSRVLTHELVRHGIGCTFAQESMRFVRLTNIPFWFPAWARGDQELMERAIALIHKEEEFQIWMADHFKLDDPGVSFHEKKHKTSFMRRFSPHGVATGVGCTFNIRAVRHIVYMRTALAAEEEIRLVMDDLAEITLAEVPNLMQDYSPTEDREWIPEFLKV